MLAKVEGWVGGGPSAAPHLGLLCQLLHSSLAAQRQLLESPDSAARWSELSALTTDSTHVSQISA